MASVWLKDMLQLIHPLDFFGQLGSHLIDVRGMVPKLDLIVIVYRPRLIKPTLLAESENALIAVGLPIEIPKILVVKPD